MHRRGARADGEGGDVRGDGRHGAGGGRAQALRKAAVTAELLAETGAGKEIKRLSKQGENADVAAGGDGGRQRVEARGDGLKRGVEGLFAD